MDTPTTSNENIILAKKAWSAYVLPLGIPIIIASGLAQSNSKGLALIPLAYAVYKFLELQSHELSANDKGVNYFSGILPWNKGNVGVLWRNLDAALFRQSALSWAFKSYDVRITQRFTQGNEIYCTSMANAESAVDYINSKITELAKSENLH
jgi:hypothetical protein